MCGHVGFARPARIAAGLFASALWISTLSSFAELRVTWIQNKPDTNRWSVEVTGLSRASLAILERTNWTLVQWQRLLAVRTEQDTLLGDIGMPTMTGTYAMEKEKVRFVPAFPLEPGVKYRASFYSRELPGAAASSTIPTAVLTIPKRAVEATTFVRQIYPSASLLPENLLKFYVHFSAPMARGHIYEHIHLRDEAGREVELPFLEIDEELWDPGMTRLTLFIDPGRIKRGVTPLEEVGPALQQGKRYTLVIDRAWKDAAGAPLQKGFQKPFQVGAVDRDPVDPGQWKIHAPRGSREPLVVSFPKPMDQAIAQRMIRVTDASRRLLAGQVSLEDEERRWTFRPAQPWQKGRHHLSVQKTIEDLAGNNIDKAFEVDLFENVPRHFTNAAVELSFEIR